MKDLGPLWHGLVALPFGMGGAALMSMGGGVAFLSFGLQLVIGLFFYLREVLQHDAHLSRWQRLEASTPLLGYAIGLVGGTFVL